MAVNLYEHQKLAIPKIQTGSILCGGVGSGKSRTAIAYFYTRECGGKIKINGKGDFAAMKNPKDLYIITTAKKRDSLEWEGECAPFMLSKQREASMNKVKVTIDSWNNIAKYADVKNAFFIFDEQRLIGSGKWVKSFIKISKSNNWILLSATPGDTWMDYIPLFIANKFYKNRTEFLTRHAVYSRFTKYPKVEKFIDVGRLNKLRDQITVTMEFKRNTIAHDKVITVPYDKEKFEILTTKRWDVYKDRPIKTISELCYLMRKVVNSDPSRLKVVQDIFKTHKKLIIFYNFDYELEILRTLEKKLKVQVSEWNGHKHQEVPEGDQWIYLVQYTAGAEGWNCITTDVIVFYSQNYSYKVMVQAAGRIDRINTTFRDLYYYHIRSNSPIDVAISKAIKKKKDFNLYSFMKEGKK